MALLLEALHQYEWLIRLLGEIALGVAAYVNDRLHRARLQALKDEIEEKSHEAETYRQEFERLNTPPPVVVPRKPKAGLPRNRNH